MSYDQAIRWNRKHRKGTRQPIIMSTGSGFWASGAWIRDSFTPYCDACKRLGVEPLDAEHFYRAITAVGHIPRTPEVYATVTLQGRLTNRGIVDL